MRQASQYIISAAQQLKTMRQLDSAAKVLGRHGYLSEAQTESLKADLERSETSLIQALREELNAHK